MIPGVRLVIFGRQGAGKGTQCIRLARHYVVPHISTGDIFRSAVKSGSDLGRRIAEMMDSGQLVPDEVVVGVVAERLSKDDTKTRGFILDGFPRTISQAEQLGELLGARGLDAAVDLDVPEDVVLDRLANRRVCRDCGANYSVLKPPRVDWTCDVCGGEVIMRVDDSEDAIRQRLDLYSEQTLPLVDWYARNGLLCEIDGVGSSDEVTQRLLKGIESMRAR